MVICVIIAHKFVNYTKVEGHLDCSAMGCRVEPHVWIRRPRRIPLDSTPSPPRRNKATPSSRALHVWLTATRRKVAQGNVEVIAGYRCNHGAALKLKALRRLS